MNFFINSLPVIIRENSIFANCSRKYKSIAKLSLWATSREQNSKYLVFIITQSGNR